MYYYNIVILFQDNKVLGILSIKKKKLYIFKYRIKISNACYLDICTKYFLKILIVVSIAIYNLKHK